MYINSIKSIPYNYKQGIQQKPPASNDVSASNKKVTVYAIGTAILLGGILLASRKIVKYLTKRTSQDIQDKINLQFGAVDKNKGLNKINGQVSVINKIKEDIIRPFLAEKFGIKMSVTNSLPNGMIINSKNTETGKELIAGFAEHMEALGYKTISVNNSIAKEPSEFSKNIVKVLQESKENFENNHEYTFINIGCVDNFAISRRADMNYLDSVNALLKPFENSSQRGVFWAGWTKDIEKLDDALVDRGCIFNAL